MEPVRASPSKRQFPIQLMIVASAAVAVAVALWLMPASVHIVGWRRAVATPVAFLAPLANLAWLLGLTLAVGTALVALWIRTNRRLEELSSALAPLVLLLLWAVPYLPWVSGRFPMLLALSGPLRWLVAGLAVGGCAWRALLLAGLRWPTTSLPGRRAAFVVSLAAFLGLGFYVKQAQGLGGDEPHYLVIAHSLLADRDLQIENNHTERHYLRFFGGALRPHFLRRGRGDVIYSIHAPGLPALLLPSYAVGGHWGAIAMMCLLAALASRAVFDLAQAMTSRSTALFTWAAVTFSIPFAVHSWMIYPEMAAALVMAWSALWVWKPPPEQPWPWFWRGLAIAVLPWLHTKFSILLIAVVVLMLVRLWPRIVPALFLLTPVACSVFLWLFSLYVMYGVSNPTVAYNYSAGAGLETANIPRGVLGLLFDQEYGLLVYSPVYLLAFAGCWVLIKQRTQRWYAIGLGVTVLVFLAGITRVYMWWGGGSAPARFLVPVLPLVAPLIAAAVHKVRRPSTRGVVGLLLAASVICFVAVAAVPSQRLMFNDRDGTGRLVEVLQAAAPVTATLPSFLQPDWQSQLPALGLWLGAGLFTLLAVRRLAGRAGPRALGPFWSPAVCLVLFGFTASVLAGGMSPSEERRAVATEGQMNLLAAYDGARLGSVDLDRLARLDTEELLGHAIIVQRYGPGVDIKSVEMAGPFRLPPGRYEARVWFRRGSGFDGELRLRHHRGPGVLARTRGGVGNPAVLSFDLPVSIPAATLVASDLRLARSVSAIEIIPQDVVPRSARLDIENPRVIDLAGDYLGGYVLYVDDNTYPEGGMCWVRGGRSGSLLVSPAGASLMRVRIRNGATAGVVSVHVAGSERVFDLEPYETRELQVALSGDQALVPIVVFPRGGFRPAEVVPGSRDRRWLGCQVSIGLI